AAGRIVNANGGQVWSKQESDGSFIVALFNTNTTGDLDVSVDWAQVGFTGSADVTDVWSGDCGGRISDSFTAALRPRESRMIRAVPPSAPRTPATDPPGVQ